MTITGKVHHIGATETVGSNGFTKRQLVVDTGEKYNPLLPIEFAKDKGDLLNALQVGQTVTVHLNLGGREYGGKFYASIGGWKIDVSAPPQNISAPPQAQSAPPQDGLDLPF